MTLRGAVNYNRNTHCKNIPDTQFCGLKKIDLSIPKHLNQEILALVPLPVGKRVTIPGWKAGRTINTMDVMRRLPKVYGWYLHLENTISKIIGEKVYVTSETLPTTCAILIYENDDDFINWHYDVNYFNGRFFTLLIPSTITNTCTTYSYYDSDNNIREIKEEAGKAILFEGDKIFHMATKFCNKGQKRVMMSVQFSTNPSISWYNRILMRVKDYAYIGL